jgi:hypothetical protein
LSAYFLTNTIRRIFVLFLKIFSGQRKRKRWAKKASRANPTNTGVCEAAEFFDFLCASGDFARENWLIQGGSNQPRLCYTGGNSYC